MKQNLSMEAKFGPTPLNLVIAIKKTACLEFDSEKLQMLSQHLDFY